MSLARKLADERRARLAAEQLLEQKRAELTEANRRLGLHARVLTEEITETRARAATMESENSRVRSQLGQTTERLHIIEGQLWQALGSIRDGFGQTEMTACIGNSPGQTVKVGSMGRPLPGYPVVLLDPVTGAVVEHEGEIALDLTNPPLGLMAGYFDDPENDFSEAALDTPEPDAPVLPEIQTLPLPEADPGLMASLGIQMEVSIQAGVELSISPLLAASIDATAQAAAGVQAGVTSVTSGATTALTSTTGLLFGR